MHRQGGEVVSVLEILFTFGMGFLCGVAVAITVFALIIETLEKEGDSDEL